MIKSYDNWIFQGISLRLGIFRAPDTILAFFGGGDVSPKEADKRLLKKGD